MASLAPHVRGHLYPGMPVNELRNLTTGCTHPRWVCPRLITIRKRYDR